MKTVKIIICIIIVIALIHFLPYLYTDRIPFQGSVQTKIPGVITIDISGEDYTKYFVIEGSLSVAAKKKGFWVENIYKRNKKYQDIIDKISEEKRRLDSIARYPITLLAQKIQTTMTVDSIAISPSGRYALKLDNNWTRRTREILDLTSGDVIMEIPTWSAIYPPIAFSWNYSGEYLAMSTSDTVHDGGEHGLLILNLSSMHKKYLRFDKPIKAITWSPNSKELAVITQSVRYVYCPINLLFRLSGHNLLYWSYYLTIINIESNSTLELGIVKDTRESCCARVYWTE